MSSYLWKYYYEDDVDKFRQLLEAAGRQSTPRAGVGAYVGASGFNTGSPSGLATSPAAAAKIRKVSGLGIGTTTPSSGGAPPSLTKADINWRDANGMTILHHAASSRSDNALEFAMALIEHPLVDLYLQDYENGWTSLHRAFYFGNITIVRAILERDAGNALGMTTGHVQQTIGLIKVKDREGNGPLDLYAATIQDRTLRPEGSRRQRSDSSADEEDEHAAGDSGDGQGSRRRTSISYIALSGNELFTFGNNKNVSLGFGDEDDRHFPERIKLRRPEHLLQRFYLEHIEEQEHKWASHDPAQLTKSANPPSVPAASIPWIVRSRPLVFQDVHMSKLHTAVLTADPESNLYMCGHGPGGRLGTGHERTCFNFVCIEGGALASKKIATIALGQNHTLALSDEGEIFSWGSNAFGQLGYSLPKSGLNDDDLVNLIPRQIFGPLKRETVVGIAASRIHSIAYTANSLYTFGKNEGQLGIVDSDARSLDMQVIPRKVAASLFTSSIESATATERATICLLENHEVWVFTNYGYARCNFPLDGFTNYFLQQSFRVTKYDTSVNQIIKVTAGGDTICALSSSGEVFTVSVAQRLESPAASSSTTNPAKIRSALSPPQRIWSPRKSNMAARDVGVDADSAIILATEEGSVWKRTRRAKIKDATAAGTGDYKPRDYKFSRVPGLNRVIAVKASAHGAYAAVRRDCDVTKTQLVVEGATLWKDVASLLCFRRLGEDTKQTENDAEDSVHRFWQRRAKNDELQALTQRVLDSKDIESELARVLKLNTESADNNNFDAVLRSTASEIELPVHRFILTGRSRVLRRGFRDLCETSTFTIHDLAVFELDHYGRVIVKFHGLDILTLLNFVLYLYTDTVIDFWHHTKKASKMTFRYRQVRTELMKLASKLELPKLEPAVRQMIAPKSCLSVDLEMAIKDPAFFYDGDIDVQLADGETRIHSALVCERCPFFKGLFNGRADGRWVAGRDEDAAAVRVDLQHVTSSTFGLVLRHIYCDTADELFGDVVCESTDDFLDVVMDTMGVANELMLDRLSQICQRVVGQFVTVRNVCSLINAIAPSSVHEFKDASMEYLCLSLEAMLQNGLLDELEEDLLAELDDVVRSNQLARLPFARSGRAEAALYERHPELAAVVDRNRQAKVDAVTIRTKHSSAETWTPGSFGDDVTTSPSVRKARRRSSNQVLADAEHQVLMGKVSTTRDVIFEMDEEPGPEHPSPSIKPSSAIGVPETTRLPEVWYDAKGRPLASPSNEPTGTALSTSQATSKSPLIAARTPPSDKPWSMAPLPGMRTDLKEVLAQTSPSRTSSLTQGLAAGRGGIASPRLPAPTPAKISQRERKKMQQTQQYGDTVASTLPVQVRARPADVLTITSSSPWQVASARKVQNLKDVISSEKSLSPAPSPKASIARTLAAPQLTMRQTLANAKPTASHKPVIGPANHRQLPHGNVSGPSDGKSPIPVFARALSAQVPSPNVQASASASPPTSIATPRSIHHQPRPVEPSLQLSMHDILFLQQAEKDIVKEAVAKRDLHDIQAEQEFQQWWDEESARVMQEEQRVNAPPRGPQRAKRRGGKVGGASRPSRGTGDVSSGAGRGG